MNLINQDSSRTSIFGILNITPDSFSDGGKFLDFKTAIAQAKNLRDQGADVIDVGGESTRPGAARISLDEEIKRVLPVIQALVSEGFVVSIDTMRAEVAEIAVTAGAKFVNDVSGGKADPKMFDTVAKLGVAYILMHWRGESSKMDQLAVYKNVADEVIAEIKTQVDQALTAGIKQENLAIDPGIGFAKNPQQNWELLAKIQNLNVLNLPILVGHSRKRFLNELFTADELDLQARDFATAAISYQLALAKVWAVRVHDAKSTYAAIQAAHRIQKETI